MNKQQKTYTAFIENVCNKFNCPEMAPALKEGFQAFCEAVDMNLPVPDDVSNKVQSLISKHPYIDMIDDTSYQMHWDNLPINTFIIGKMASFGFAADIIETPDGDFNIKFNYTGHPIEPQHNQVSYATSIRAELDRRTGTTPVV